MSISDERLAFLAKWSVYHCLPGGVITPTNSYLEDPEEIHDILTELQFLRAAKVRPSAAGAVKALEWRHEAIPPAWEWLASSAVGLYCIPGHMPDHTLRFRDKEILGQFPTIDAAKAAAQADFTARILSTLTRDVTEQVTRKYSLGDLVTKTKGASWTGKVVGFYSTDLTPIGYAVESINEPGSVQIYPEAALAGVK